MQKMRTQAEIADYIRKKGIKQISVAEKCGFTKQKMNAIANNKQRLSVEDYEKICIALGVPFDFFYNRAKEGES